MLWELWAHALISSKSVPYYLLAFCKTEYWLLLQLLCIAATSRSTSTAINPVYANDLTQEHMVAKRLEFFWLQVFLHITKLERLKNNHARQLGVTGAILTVLKTWLCCRPICWLLGCQGKEKVVSKSCWWLLLAAETKSFACNHLLMHDHTIKLMLLPRNTGADKSWQA